MANETYSIEAVLSARDEGFKAGMKAAQKSASGFGSTIKSGLGLGVFMGLGQKAFGAVAAGVKSMGTELSASTATWKTFNGNMKMMGKGAGDIKKVRGELQTFAEKTIYSSSDMATTYSQMAAVGVKSADKLVMGMGGLAAAAENPTQAMKTLSQQATQMAAKPTVQWMDFKLMLEQTPAGIAQVAKSMGKSTKQLVADVQAGKVSTNDFFKAMTKAGNSKSMQKLATQYKTVGQAMDGLKETAANKLQPAFQAVSKIGIKAISGITDKLGKIDGDKLAKKIETFTTKAGKYWKALKKTFKPVGKEWKEAFKAIGDSLGKMNGKFGSKKSVSNFTSSLQPITKALKGLADFTTKHSDQIAWLISHLPQIAAAFVGFKIVKGVAPGVMTFGKAIGKIGSGIAGLAGKLFATAAGQKAVGSSSKASNKNVLTSAKAFLRLGAAVFLIAAGFVLIAAAAIAVTNAGGGAVAMFVVMAAGLAAIALGLTKMLQTATASPKAMTALGDAMLKVGAAVLLVAAGFLVMSAAAVALSDAGAPAMVMFGIMLAGIVALGLAFTVMAKTLAPVAPALVTISAALLIAAVAVIAVAVGFALLSAAAIAVSSAGAGAIVMFVVMVALIAALALVFAALGPALDAASPAMLAFGACVLMVGAGLLLAATAAQVAVNALGNLVGILPGLAQYGLSGAVAILAIGAAMLVFGAGALVAGAGALVLAAGLAAVALAAIPLIAAVTLLISTLRGTPAAAQTGSAALTSMLGPIGKVGTALGAAKDKISGFFAKLTGDGNKSANAVSQSTGKVNKAFDTTSNKAGASGKKGGNEYSNGLLSGITKSVGGVKGGIGKVLSAMQSGNGKMASNGKAGGNSYIKGLTGSLSGGKGSKSIQNMLNGMKGTSRSGGLSVGKVLGNGVSTGISSSSGKSKAAARRTVNSVNSTYRSGASGARSAGSYIGAGLASGLESAIPRVEAAASRLAAAADKAVRAEAKVASPSKVHKKNGKYIAAGLALGIAGGKNQVAREAEIMAATVSGIFKKQIRKLKDSGAKFAKAVGKTLKAGIPVVTKYAQSLAKSTFKAFRKVSGVNSGFTNAADKLGETYEKKVSAKESAVVKAGTKKIKAAFTAKDKAYSATIKKQQKQLKKMTKGSKAYKSMAKKIKANQKKQKQTQQLSSKVQTAYQKQYEKYANKMISTVKSKLTTLAETYQKQWDALAEKQSGLQDKLNDYGDLYSTDKYGFTAFKDFKAATTQVQKYYNNLKLLKGIVSSGFFEEITKLDTAAGLAYTNELLKKGTSWIKAYSNTFDTFINTGKQDAASIYKSDFDALTNNFKSATDAITAQVSAKLKQIGADLKKSLSNAVAQASGNKKASKAVAKANAAAGKAKKTSVKSTAAAKQKAATAKLVAQAKKDNAKVAKANKSTGKNATKGLAKGIASKKATKKVTKSSKKVAKKATKATKKKLKVHSPSKVFMQIGQYVGEGFAIGMDRMQASVQHAAENMMDLPSPAAPAFASGYGGSLSSELSSDYTYGSTVNGNITVVTELDGKVVAKKTAPYMEQEIGKRQTRAERVKGRV
ncbi:MAG TPA: hypothetical protein DCZ61_09710 [Lachnospiraceae bacterium]|nr:hypothetical protein [Lachnospiraceae bacterium]